MKRFFLVILLILPAIYLSRSVFGTENNIDLYQRLESIIDAYPGTIGVSVIDILSSNSFQYNSEEMFPAESTIKVPIMVTAYNLAVHNVI